MAKVKPEVVLVGPTASHFKGGIVHYTACLYRTLVKKKIKTTLISFSRGYPKAFFPGVSSQLPPSKFTHIGSVLELLDWLNPLSWWTSALLIIKKKPETVIFQWWTWFWTVPFFFVLLVVKNFTKSKIVIIAHNPFDHEQALYKRWSSHLVLGLADKILVPSTDMKKSLHQLFPEKKIVQAFHPLYSFFQTKKITQAKAQKKLGIGSPLLLFFGHIRSYKGLAVLLKALDYLWGKGKKVNLLVAGEFWEDKQKYLSLIKPENRKKVKIVDYYLPDDEVNLYFSASDAVVIPYLAGSGSGPAKIALAFKKPILATKVADNPDLFKLVKVGELVRPGQVRELAKAIEKILIDPSSYAREIEALKPQLSWEALIDKIL